MKKVLAAFLIFSFLYMNYLPVLAAEKNINKPRVSTFNKAIKSEKKLDSNLLNILKMASI